MIMRRMSSEQTSQLDSLSVCLSVCLSVYLSVLPTLFSDGLDPGPAPTSSPPLIVSPQLSYWTVRNILRIAGPVVVEARASAEPEDSVGQLVGWLVGGVLRDG